MRYVPSDKVIIRRRLPERVPEKDTRGWRLYHQYRALEGADLGISHGEPAIVVEAFVGFGERLSSHGSALDVVVL